MYLLGALIVVLFFGIISKKQQLFASASASDPSEQYLETTEEHFVTIFDGTTKTTLRSSAATVQEVLARAKITLDEADLVEPALDETINANNFNINIYRARELVVLDGQNKIFTKTAATEPLAIAKAAGVVLLENDVVEVVHFNSILESGALSAFRVVRAKTVYFNYSGRSLVLRTQAATVADFLATQGITLDQDQNWASLPASTKITDGLKLSFYYQGEQTITVDEEIPFTEQLTYDYSLDYGQSEIIQVGVPGKRTAVYRIDVRDGQELSRTLVSEVVSVVPVEQQRKVGMKVVLPAGSHTDWMAAAGISPSDYGVVNFIVEHESHWNPIAKNRSSGAYGLCQALPGSKMASAGSDWETNPITQLKWCKTYATGRYGSWQAAYEFWDKNHWW